MHFPLGLAPLVARPRHDIGLEVRATRGDSDDRAQLHISAREWALGVHLDVAGWRPDDNHFHLAPGGCVSVNLARLRDGAPLAGALHALNLAGPVAVEIHA
jgi:beta-mannosidase